MPSIEAINKTISEVMEFERHLRDGWQYTDEQVEIFWRRARLADFEKQTRELRRAGHSEEEVAAFWKGMGTFGDDDPLDAVDGEEGGA